MGARLASTMRPPHLLTSLGNPVTTWADYTAGLEAGSKIAAAYPYGGGLGIRVDSVKATEPSICLTQFGRVSLTDSGLITAQGSVTATMAATEWFSLAVSNGTDRKESGNAEGYELLLRQNGSLELYRISTTGSATSLGTASGTTFSANATQTLTLQITSTHVIGSWLEQSKTISVADTTTRLSDGWWVHVGKDDTAVEFALERAWYSAA